MSKQKELEGFKSSCTEKMKLLNDNLIKFYNYLILTEDELSRGPIKVSLAFEYLSSTLIREMVAKKQKSIFFSEKEIIRMLHHVLNALLYLEVNGIYHEYISPYTILAENGLYKINDIQFATNETGYKKCFLGHTEYCYLSPRLL